MIPYRIIDGEVFVPTTLGWRRPESHEVTRIVLQQEAVRDRPVALSVRYRLGRFWRSVSHAFLDGYRRGR